jgi:hypothetical protein
MAGVCTGPGPCDIHPTGHGGTNWLTKVGGLPPYARAIVNALKRSGHSESEAVQLAWGVLRNWARGGGNVSAATRARAAAAVASLEAKRAAAHALSVTRSEAIDLSMPKGTMPGPNGPRFPINNHGDLRRAVKAVGRAKGDHAKVRRHIMSRAKAIGGSHLIPDNWASDGGYK